MDLYRVSPVMKPHSKINPVNITISNFSTIPDFIIFYLKPEFRIIQIKIERAELNKISQSRALLFQERISALQAAFPELPALYPQRRLSGTCKKSH